MSPFFFASPISYWDPRHYGLIFVVVEWVFALGASAYVGWTGQQTAMRSVALATLFLYLASIAFALVVWLPQLVQRP